ncbi:MAG TPA: hypothetical protein DCY03_20090 [Planctomycetaceae bacterium]|nr:hypothetical protein [Planctomycetaceae bacterium]
MNFNEESKLTRVFLTLLFLGGAVGFWQTVKMVSGPEPQRAMSPGEVRETLEKMEAQDRKAWENMWREAGKTPPVAPPVN